MKKISTILSLCALMFAACNYSNKDSATEVADSTEVISTNTDQKESVTGKIELISTAKIGEPINIKFTVYNHADTAAKFCKWHTPFEKLLSKYLDVTHSDGTEVSYKGAMAKRVMPPPADSYVSLNPGDSTSIDFNLTDGYAIEKLGTYTVKYNSGQMSGIHIPDSLKMEVSQ